MDGYNTPLFYVFEKWKGNLIHSNGIRNRFALRIDLGVGWEEVGSSWEGVHPGGGPLVGSHSIKKKAKNGVLGVKKPFIPLRKFRYLFPKISHLRNHHDDHHQNNHDDHQNDHDHHDDQQLEISASANTLKRPLMSC